MTAPTLLIFGDGDYIDAALARRFAQGGSVVSFARSPGYKLTDPVYPISASREAHHNMPTAARDELPTITLLKTHTLLIHLITLVFTTPFHT